MIVLGSIKGMIMEELTEEQKKQLAELADVCVQASDFVQSILAYAATLDIKPTKAVLASIEQIQFYIYGFYHINILQGNNERASQALLSGIVAAYVLGLIEDQPQSKINEVLQ
jgi:hypothetical protein